MLENFIGHGVLLAYCRYDLSILFVQHMRYCGVQCIARSVSQPR